MARKPKYGREVLLRDLHERTAGYAYLSAALGLVFVSELAFLVPTVAYSGAALFTARGIQRFAQAHKVRKYQKGITNLPAYQMTSDQIRISYKQQFLGVGFRWTTKHTQRIYDLEQSENEHFEQMSKGYQRARDFCYNNENNKTLKPVVNFLESKHFLNPWKPVLDLGGKPSLHAVGMLEGEKPVLQPIDTRVAHTLVQGTTRVGKTRLAELLIAQDIARGDIVIVFDPKGDADLLTRCYLECEKAGRIDNFYAFHLGFPEISAQYNPVGNFLRMTEVASRIAGQMPGEGQSLAFKEFVWSWVNMLTKGIVGLGKTPNYPLIKSYAQDMEPLFIEYLGQIFIQTFGDAYKDEISKIEAILPLKPDERKAAGVDITLPRSMQERGLFGKAHYVFFLMNRDKLVMTAIEEDTALSLMKGYQTDRSYMAKLVASLDPFLDKMTTGVVSELVSPDFEESGKDVFSFSQAIQSKAVIYIGLDALSDAEVSAAVGNSMFSDLTSVAGRLYKHGRHHGLPTYEKGGYEPKICLHADEFNELAGKEFIPMLNKAGGAGIQVTAYTQTASDMEARLGVTAQARQMEGNFNTLIMMRVLNEETARLLIEKQRQVSVRYKQEIGGAADNSDIESDVHFTSSQQTRDLVERTDLIRVTDLTNLPKGQAFALINGNNLYKLRIPWLKPGKKDKLPKNIAEMAKQMRSRYANLNDDWYKYHDDFNPVSVINKNLKEGQGGYNAFVKMDLEMLGDTNGF